MADSDLLASDPVNHLPDQTGKVVLITGGTNGLGAQAALALAKHNAAFIYISGRNEKAAGEVIQKAKDIGSKSVISFLQADLTDLESIRKAADKVLGEQSRLDLLMANAGIMAKPPGLTKDGYELHFGTNHLGHALLIRKLLPLMQATASKQLDTRIVILTSLGWELVPKGGILFDKMKDPQDMLMGPWYRYGESKLANNLYAKELSRRYPDITSVSCHPGVVETGLVNSLPLAKRLFVQLGTIGMKKFKVEEGVFSQLWCAGAPNLKEHNGAFYEPVGILSKRTSVYTEDPAFSVNLWDYTEKELAPFLSCERLPFRVQLLPAE